MEADQGQPALPAPESLKFTGSGGEYFRIWIVNLLLTIFTLGIYSAWAKVRRTQYFYRNTHLAGASFDYHGKPLSILKGRLIALGLLLAYNTSASVSPRLFALTALLLIAVMPWLLRQSFRFRLHNSSYRGLRFRFAGTTGGAYETFLIYGILAFVTAYIAAPLFHQRLKQYQHGNTYFGGARGSFHAGAGGFYGIYLRAFFSVFGLIALLGIVAAILVPALGKAGGGSKATMLDVIVPLLVGVYLVALLFVTPYVTARLQNLIWNNTRLGEHRFHSSAAVWPLFRLYLGNFFGVLLSLGLFMPWASVRIARYRASTLTMLPAGNLEEFIAIHEQETGAAGDAAAEFFDIDIGL